MKNTNAQASNQPSTETLVASLNNAITATIFTGGKTPQWRYDNTTTGVIIINKALADRLTLDGVNLPKYASGTPRTRFNYSTTPELYKALEQLLATAYPEYKQALSE